MNLPVSSHRPQSVLTLYQTLVIIAGSLATRVILKAQGYPQEYYYHWNFPVFVRDWALIFLLIPICWAFVSIKAEEKSVWWTQRYSTITGLCLLVLLSCIMIMSIGGALMVHKAVTIMRIDR